MVSAGYQNEDICINLVNESMFMVDAALPFPRQVALQWFGFSDSIEC